MIYYTNLINTRLVFQIKHVSILLIGGDRNYDRRDDGRDRRRDDRRDGDRHHGNRDNRQDGRRHGHDDNKRNRTPPPMKKVEESRAPVRTIHIILGLL